MPSPRSRTPTARTRARGSRSERGASPDEPRSPVEVEALPADDAEPDATDEVEAPAPAATPEVQGAPRDTVARGEELAGALVPADSLQRYLAEIRRIPLLSR
jgi:hypothetical protein